ncbi:isocitrate lyase/phosphoenolpyruvate mutase family protein [Flavitalea sp.]
MSACALPVSADLENGYGDDPDICAETIILSAKIGLAGGSIDDATGKLGDPIYPFTELLPIQTKQNLMRI